MKYINIKKADIANGTGVRVVLFVSGCDHYCKGCHNEITWNPNTGLEFDDNTRQEIFNQLEKGYISGITLSGGDPLYESNRKDILSLIIDINNKYPNKTIWLYTGYTFEELKEMDNIIINSILEKIDVLIDGKFIEDLKDLKCKWRGSSNQKIYELR